jgi:hypothetical protein
MFNFSMVAFTVCMRKNHLIEPIQCIVEAATAPLSEYELISQLQEQEWLTRIDSANTVSLYSAHFLVYNALFQLHAYYLERQQYLTISALTISLNGENNVDVNHDGTEIESRNVDADSRYNQADITSLRDYYLDWNHLESATQESVEGLLKGFWDRFVSDDDYTNALTALELLNDGQIIDYQQVKVAYQRLAMKHHPDRGGDVEQFQRINWAFGVLRRAL